MSSPRTTVASFAVDCVALLGFAALAAVIVFFFAGCGDSSGETSTTSGDSSSASTSATAPDASKAYGEMCGSQLECRPGLVCDGVNCGAYPDEWFEGYCEQDQCAVHADCSSLDGKSQQCLAWGVGGGFHCVWRCMTDADCPTSLGVAFECSNREYTSIKTCTALCTTP
jgi:hypothetical protein